ncbi:hypothetical protein RRG08_044532 [Elysia crispata]|uniref:Uncharacterized protein n=1 Tax=Elysia crispata TaxID=231223 RepID=A0AAE0ZBI7_9GAST|nr:hypothetical protein RRG08_044532 [Elysia crispata]
MCMTLRAPCLRRTFSGRSSSKSLHSADCRFVSGSQEYTQVSSPVIFRPKNYSGLDQLTQKTASYTVRGGSKNPLILSLNRCPGTKSWTPLHIYIQKQTSSTSMDVTRQSDATGASPIRYGCPDYRVQFEAVRRFTGEQAGQRFLGLLFHKPQAVFSSRVELWCECRVRQNHSEKGAEPRLRDSSPLIGAVRV